MIPQLSDFTSKYGFREGAAIESRDEHARDKLIDEFNHKSKSIRAVAWSRPGMHNWCMLVFFKRHWGWKPVQYIDAWHRKEITPLDPEKVRLPGNKNLQTLIEEIYEWLHYEGYYE